MEQLESNRNENKKSLINQIEHVNRQSNRELISDEDEIEQYRRIYTIKLPYYTGIAFAEEVSQDILEANESVQKIYEEFEMQSSIQSDYVVKNEKMMVMPTSVVFVQEDYSLEFFCYFSVLSEYPIHTLTFSERLHIIYCIGLGLQDLFNNNIVHRSLSPSCICLIPNEDGMLDAKINDFETAVRISEVKSPLRKSTNTWKKLKNNDGYVCPELKNEQNYSFAVDVWSFGVVINYVLYGNLSNIKESNNKFLVSVPKGTPQWLYELLTSMLCHNPEKRYTIETVVDILKVSRKFADQIGKFVLLNKEKYSEETKFNENENEFEEFLENEEE